MGMEDILEFQGQFRFLSNFWPCNVNIHPFSYPTSEHAYVHAKTGYSPAYTDLVVGCQDPGQVKRLGRSLPLAPGFEARKVQEMYKIVLAKFTQNPALRQKLLDTGNVRLVEGNAWGDRFWGVCRGVGENYLGRILMKVREELRKRYCEPHGEFDCPGCKDIADTERRAAHAS